MTFDVSSMSTINDQRSSSASERKIITATRYPLRRYEAIIKQLHWRQLVSSYLSPVEGVFLFAGRRSKMHLQPTVRQDTRAHSALYARYYFLGLENGLISYVDSTLLIRPGAASKRWITYLHDLFPNRNQATGTMSTSYQTNVLV